MTTKTTEKAKAQDKSKTEQAETKQTEIIDNATDTANNPAEQPTQETDTNTDDSAEKTGAETKAPEKKEDAPADKPAEKPAKKPASKAKSAEKPKTKGYKCQWQLRHSGKIYQAGDEVKLTDEEADSLKETGVIKGDDA